VWRPSGGAGGIDFWCVVVFNPQLCGILPIQMKEKSALIILKVCLFHIN